MLSIQQKSLTLCKNELSWNREVFIIIYGVKNHGNIDSPQIADYQERAVQHNKLCTQQVGDESEEMVQETREEVE